MFGYSVVGAWSGAVTLAQMESKCNARIWHSNFSNNKVVPRGTGQQGKVDQFR